jgi:uncharacterized membrane protein (UPF0127 family)/phosphatidylserine synthase
MKLSNRITASRFLFGIFMIISAYFRNIYAFTAFYFVALISDIADGFVARKLKQESFHGRKLDILADNFIVVCLIASFFLIKKEVILSYRWHILALFGYFVLVQFVNFNLKKKFLFMRTYSANLAAILFPFVVFGFLVFDAKYIAYAYIFLMYYSLTEKLFLSVFKFEASSIFSLKRMRLKGFFILVFTILIALVINIPVINENKACFSDNYCVNVEIRNTPEGRELGLMFKDNLEENEAMLFIFDSPVEYAFWMKNMKIPIDIIFISADKKIVSVSQDAQPCNKPDTECELYYPVAQYLYVVETKANFSARHNLSMGQDVGILR